MYGVLRRLGPGPARARPSMATSKLPGLVTSMTEGCSLCLHPHSSMLSLFSKTLNPAFPLRVSSSRSFSLPQSTRTIVRNMSSGSRMFQLKLDPLTGNSEWVVIEESDTPEQTPTPLLATTSYLDMLNDSPRNRAFREAIDKTVTKPCHVLDIGYPSILHEFPLFF